MLRTSKVQHRLNCFETSLMESYIKSFDLGISLRLDHTFVSAKVGKTIVIRRTRRIPKLIKIIAETFLVRILRHDWLMPQTIVDDVIAYQFLLRIDL